MVEEGQVIDTHNADEWDKQFQMGKDTRKLWTLLLLGVAHAVSLHPVLADIAKKTPNITVLKVYVDELPNVAAEWQVEAMPTFLFFKEGKALEKLVGAKKEELQQLVASHATTAAA